MKNYLDKMNEEVIISNETIESMRKNIRDKYPAISKRGQASLLAKEMNNVLDEHMNGVPVEFRSEIRTEIYTSFISAISDHLTKLDVFKGVESVYKGETNYLDILFEWMQNNTVYDVDYRTFKSFMVVNYEHFIETGELMDLEPILPKESYVKESFEPMTNSFPKRILLFIPVFIIITLLMNMFVNKEMEQPLSSDHVALPEIIKPFNALRLEEFVQPIYLELYVPFPEIYQYRSMDYDKVTAYLGLKNSALLEEDYIKTLDEVSYTFNVNPYLMLAIIGQEQNFIEADNINKEKIIKNPFNVYNSWEDYGISFRDSAEIAARTVRNRLDSRPLGNNAILWINATYAEDPDWHKGVSYFFEFFNENM